MKTIKLLTTILLFILITTISQKSYSQANAGTDQEICNNYATLSANDTSLQGATGEWSDPSGNSTIHTPSLYNSQVSGLIQGVNLLVWTVIMPDGCFKSDDVIITNNDFLVNAGPNQTLNPMDDDTYFQAELPDGATGQWSIVAGVGTIQNVNSPTSYVSDIHTGANKFKWSVTQNNCTNWDTVTIFAQIFIPSAGADIFTCADSVKMSAVESGVGSEQTWSIIEGGGEFDNVNAPYTWVRNIPQGVNVYKWEVTINGIIASDTVNVIYNFAYAEAGQNQESCNNYATLSANDPSLQGATGEWSIAGFGSAGIFANKTLYNTNVTNIAAGINTFRWTVTKPDGCIASDYVYITDNTPLVNAGPDDTTNIDSYQLQALIYPLDADGAWSITAGSGVFEDFTDPNTVVNELNYGYNTFMWNATFNTCSNFDEVVILRTVNAGNDITLDGDTVYLYGILPEGAIGQWTIMYGTAVIEDPNMPHTKAWNLAQGINVFRWTVTFPDKGMVLWDEVEVNRVTGVENISSEIVIYPNPTKGLLNIDYGNKMTNANIRIFDITGSAVKFKFIKKSLNKALIKLQENKQGIYFIEIKTNKAVFTKKVIIH